MELNAAYSLTHLTYLCVKNPRRDYCQTDVNYLA